MNEPVAAAERGRRLEGRRTSAPRERQYLYAVTFARPSLQLASVGIGGVDVRAITEGCLSAVVSSVSVPRLRPERRHIAAHQQVLKRVMTDAALLPISFGVIADSSEAVGRILSRNQALLLRELNRVAGKVEMVLRVIWDVPNIFEYFVHTHAQMRSARDRFFAGGREPTREEKIEVGRLFERFLEEDRENHAERVEAVLAPHCVQIKRNQCRSERDVLNLACLVKKEEQEAFESSVFHTAQSFDNNFGFDYSGPWPPYDFVEIDLKV